MGHVDIQRELNQAAAERAQQEAEHNQQRLAAIAAQEERQRVMRALAGQAVLRELERRRKLTPEARAAEDAQSMAELRAGNQARRDAAEAKRQEHAARHRNGELYPFEQPGDLVW